MREVRTFEGKDVEGAVAAAASELGLAAAELQYEVLDTGASGFLGVGGRPARVLVTLPEPGGRGKPSEAGLEGELERFQVDLLRRLGLELAVEVEVTKEAVVVGMNGPDRDLVLQNRAELLEAFQYLLNRIFSKQLPSGRRIVVDCGSFRRLKEEELRQIALKVSERVKRTGERQELGPLNPYERRIVHLAIAGEAGVTSFSSGEGFLKRVTIAPAGR